MFRRKDTLTGSINSAACRCGIQTIRSCLIIPRWWSSRICSVAVVHSGPHRGAGRSPGSRLRKPRMADMDGLDPRASRGAPSAFRMLGFEAGRQVPCCGIEIPCLGSNSALKFPARRRREFCEKDAQHQLVRSDVFAPFYSNQQKFPAFSLLYSREFWAETGSRRTASSATHSRNFRQLRSLLKRRPCQQRHWRGRVMDAALNRYRTARRQRQSSAIGMAGGAES